MSSLITKNLDTLSFGLFDFSGEKAEAARNSIASTLTESAEANIALQEKQLATIEEQTQPLRTAATETGLPALIALALGGEIDFQSSPLLQAQLDQGRTDVLRGQTGGGAGVKSSRTFERLSDLVSGLAAEDIGRFETNNLSLLNQGLTATNQLGAAGSALTGNISQAFSGLGQGLNEAQQSFGQARNAAFQGLSSGVGNLGQLILTQG
jgi:hypothetical protein